MEIVVSHLTRMHDGHVCVAGLDRQRQCVRPVLERERLRKELTRNFGGPFCLGAVVEIGHARPRPTPPEVEDCVFVPGEARFIRLADPDKFWALLEESSRPSLKEIFGDTLNPDGRTASMPAGSGVASLGIFRPQGRVLIERNYGKLRVAISDRDLGRLSLPLTDLRLHDLEANAIDERHVDLLEDRLRRRDPLISVGVGRPWAPDDGEPRHWLQANNVHLDDNPLWPASPSAGARK